MKNNQNNDQHGTNANANQKQNQPGMDNNPNAKPSGKPMESDSTAKSKDSNPKKEFDDTDHTHKQHTIVDKKKQESEHKSDVKTNEHSATKQDNSKEGTKK